MTNYGNAKKWLACCLLLLAATLGSQGGNTVPYVYMSDTLDVISNVVMVRFKPGEAYSSAVASKKLGSPFLVMSQLLPSRYASRQHTEGSASLSTRPISPLEYAEESLLRTFRVRFSDSVHPVQMADKIMTHPSVEYAEAIVVDRVHAIPNDPLQSIQHYLRTTKADQAWQIWQGDTNTAIAVLDNAFAVSHEDLDKNRFIRSGEIPSNGIDDDGNGFVDDFNGYNMAWADDGTPPYQVENPRASSHGTEVAGLAAPSTNNSRGIAGIAFRCRWFPVRVARADRSGIEYGYQGILYAALNNFPVINCSWGSVKPFSPIDQSVIDYAIARNSVVVASGGNHGSWAPNYPSAYVGVLGVGETNADDYIQSSSGRGINAHVYAPGRDAVTTTSPSGYGSVGSVGTSFAAPLASALVALVRSRYPSLTVLQTLAFVRNTTDDIMSINAGADPSWSHFSAGRINAHKAMSTDPLTIPGVLVLEMAVTRRGSSERVVTYSKGDTLFLSFKMTSLLGRAGDVNVFLSPAGGTGWSVSMIDDEHIVESVGSDTTFWSPTFRMIVHDWSADNTDLSLRVECSASEIQQSPSFFNLRAPNLMATFASTDIIVSAGNNGTYGFSDGSKNKHGLGLLWRNRFQLLNHSGFAFRNGDDVTAAYSPSGNFGVDVFTTVLPYLRLPDTASAVYQYASSAGTDIVNVHIRQSNLFDAINPSAAYIDFMVTNNVSTTTLRNVVCGMILDFDLGYAALDNVMEDVTDSLSHGVPGVRAMLISRVNFPAWVGLAVQPLSSNTVGHLSGSLYSQTSLVRELTKTDATLSSAVGDIVAFAGIRHQSGLAYGDSIVFRVTYIVDTSRERTLDSLSRVISVPVGVSQPSEGSQHDLRHPYPNPAEDRIFVPLRPGDIKLTVVDMLGRIVMVRHCDKEAECMLTTKGWLAGTYSILVTDNQSTRRNLISVIR